MARNEMSPAIEPGRSNAVTRASSAARDQNEVNRMAGAGQAKDASKERSDGEMEPSPVHSVMIRTK